MGLLDLSLGLKRQVLKWALDSMLGQGKNTQKRSKMGTEFLTQVIIWWLSLKRILAQI